MTDEQINNAIAKACGITQADQHGTLYRTDADGWTYNCPDYCNDLNAMHEAEHTLDEDQRWTMARHIERNDTRWYFMSTARERAEAFLRTIGKWEQAK